MKEVPFMFPVKISDFYSKIDSDRFGIFVAKISDAKHLSEDILNLLKAENYDLVISRIDAKDIHLLNQVEDLGFRVKDVQLTYMFDLQKSVIKFDNYNSQLNVREALESDLSQLEVIAVNAFINYGHYFSDKRLDKSKCMEVYKDWTKNALTQTSDKDKFWVAESNGSILGYLAFKEKRDQNGIYSAGVIGAVNSSERGKNVFSSLTIEGLKWAKSVGHDWQEHNVLNTNFPVNRVFSKLGFYIYKSEITLHCWLK